jgi:methylglutaconyl-CoA hydratase
METVRVESREAVTTVTLQRPDARNAFDERVIADVTAAFSAIPPDTRVVVLAGAGPVFCAGADAGWMKRSKGYTEEQNARDAYAMAAMLRAIDECPRPVIARIHGAALGGGGGLAAACDVAIAAEGTQFGFTEVRLGLIPAVISTFVLPRIGARAARRYFLTGERFGAAEARAIGLVHEVAAPDALDARVDALAREFLLAGPEAVAAAKRLIREASELSREEAIDYTVRTLARLRVTPEAQEGLGAFLEKRKPQW